MKHTLYIIGALILLVACNNSTSKKEIENVSVEKPYNAKIGAGKFDNVILSDTLDEKLIAEGKKLLISKCICCHNLTTEASTGPGWLNITERRSPEWILNFLTNSEEMLDKDKTLKAQISAYKVRMPNQNLSDNDAKAIFEFMRNNDKNNK
jgi:mono/diheme cytochrome c family protein